jgi:predicted TIM-barrel fold metal-dependent hydrolase
LSGRLLGQHVAVLRSAGADVDALARIEEWARRSVVVPEGTEVVDAHVHLGVDRDGHALSAGDLIADMDANGIHRAVVFPADEPGPGGDFRESNRRVLEAAEGHPDRFIPFCRVDPSVGAAAAIDEARAGGARGLKLHPVAQRFAPEGEECVAVVRLATDLGWPVLFHAGFGARPLGPAFAGLLEQVPDASLILAHGGRGDHRALAAATAAYPDVLFDTSIAALPDLATLPPERIVFGTDRPYGDHAQALHLVGAAARVAGWDATAMRGVMGANLLRLLGEGAS